MKKVLLSVCIPTYEMHGEAKKFLTRSFDILKKQTFKDFEVVVSDNSADDVVKNLCADPEYALLDINYVRNPIKGMAPNTNTAIKNAKGDIIKILYMDDFLAHENSLKKIAENFRGYWMVTGCEHDDGLHRYNPHYPKYDKKIHFGQNTIGSPSVLAIRNENPLFFDERMTWLLDCDYYKRMYNIHGEPVILNDINVVIGTGGHQMTKIITKRQKLLEHILLHFK